MSAFNDYCVVCDQLIVDVFEFNEVNTDASVNGRLYCSEQCRDQDGMMAATITGSRAVCSRRRRRSDCFEAERGLLNIPVVCGLSSTEGHLRRFPVAAEDEFCRNTAFAELQRSHQEKEQQEQYQGEQLDSKQSDFRLLQGEQLGPEDDKEDEESYFSDLELDSYNTTSISSLETTNSMSGKGPATGVTPRVLFPYGITSVNGNGSGDNSTLFTGANGQQCAFDHAAEDNYQLWLTCNIGR